MSSGISNVLGSYDLFGKSIPGIVLILGLFLLLPSVPIGTISGTEEINLPTVAASALVLVFLGLVVGQAVHTFADNVEKVMYRIGKSVLNQYYLGFSGRIWGVLESRCGRIYRFLALLFWLFSQVRKFIKKRLPRFYRFLVLINPITYISVIRSYIHSEPWFERRYWGIHDSFKSHRRLFENELGWYFDISTQKRTSGVPNISFEHFRECCQMEFDIDIARFDENTTKGVELNGYRELRQLYPMVASKVANSDANRAEGFQARYSFCRGMWVVLFSLLCTYIAVLWPVYTPQALDYTPILLSALDRSELGLSIWVMLSLTFLFVDASGDYKRNYIEYLVIDFCSVVRGHEKTLSPDSDDTQEQVQRERNPPYYR